MPAFLTHWRVLIETARRSQDAGSDLGSLIIEKDALLRRLRGFPTLPQTTPAGAVWATGPLPEISFHFPGSDISAMAFLGALAPDIPNYQIGHFKDKISDANKRRQLALQAPPDGSIPWAVLLHSNRSGDVLLSFIEQSADIPSPALRSQALAFAMGYLSHIATDIALNPCINVLANTYQPGDIPGLFAPLGLHYYAEMCLDEYIATSYFEHERYSWLNQPWAGYIEPAARNLATTELGTQLLDLLISSVEATYGLTEQQSTTFRADYLAGLRRLHLYLAGRGSFRWFDLKALLRKRTNDPVIATIADQQRFSDGITFEEVIHYAIRLSEQLCRRAISYYAALRNTSASAHERSQRRLALRNDLRNWDLNTGYTVEVSFDQEVSLRFLHNWIHFAALWNDENAAPFRMQSLLKE